MFSFPHPIFLQVISILRMPPTQASPYGRTQIKPPFSSPPAPAPAQPHIISPCTLTGLSLPVHPVPGPRAARAHTPSMAPHCPQEKPRLPTWGLRSFGTWSLKSPLLSSPTTLTHSQWPPSPLVSLLLLLQGEFSGESHPRAGLA